MNRDAATYVESSVGPEEITDSIEDQIREAAMPLVLSDDAVSKIAMLLKLENCVTESKEFIDSSRVLEVFLNHFHPRVWTIQNWWAVQFAVGSKHCEGILPSDIAKLLRTSREAMSDMVGKWRRKLNIPQTKDLWRESTRIGQRRRRLRNQKKRKIKSPKKQVKLDKLGKVI